MNLALTIVTSVVASIGTCVLAVYSFAGRWIERRIEHRHSIAIEELHATLAQATAEHEGRVERAAYRSRVQFDTEFDLMREIWRDVSDLRRHVFMLPGSDSAVQDPIEGADVAARTKQQRDYLIRLRELEESLDTLKQVVHDNEPFVVSSVFDGCQALIRFADDLIPLRVNEHHLIADQQWRRDRLHESGAFHTRVIEIASVMRKHLANVIIVE